MCKKCRANIWNSKVTAV